MSQLGACSMGMSSLSHIDTRAAIFGCLSCGYGMFVSDQHTLLQTQLPPFPVCL